MDRKNDSFIEIAEGTIVIHRAATAIHVAIADRVAFWIGLGEVSEFTNAILKAAGLEYTITMRQTGEPNGNIDGERGNSSCGRPGRDGDRQPGR